MKRLVLVRHGNYDMTTKELNQYGRERVASLADKLRLLAEAGDRITILSSTAKRATQSAEIISAKLTVPFTEHEILWSERYHREDLPAATELIRSVANDFDVVVLVSHLEYSERLPAYFGTNELGVPLPSPDIAKGEGWFIDCESKQLRLLRL